MREKLTRVRKNIYKDMDILIRHIIISSHHL